MKESGEKLVLRGYRGLLDNREKWGLKENKELLVIPVSKGYKDHRVIRDYKVQLVLLETLDLLVHRALKVLRENEV
jgi:hypothetical protein